MDTQLKTERQTAVDLESKLRKANEANYALHCTVDGLEAAVGEARAESEEQALTIKSLQQTIDKLVQDKLALFNKSLTLGEAMSQASKSTTGRWKSDSDVSACVRCAVQFSLTCRRHHCRVCGNIFCHECSDRHVSLSGSRKPERACIDCFTFLSLQKRDRSLVTGSTHGSSPVPPARAPSDSSSLNGSEP
eukprot:m.111152 g.111152  ORF g.111152 m.111152 type:complete len:191 (+) comp19219_c0_seq1:1472-2044(+)